MTSSHFVARLKLALHRHEHLDHFHHARGQIITTADLFNLVLEPGIQSTLLRLILLVQRLDHLCRLLVFQSNLPPCGTWERIKHIRINSASRAYALWTLRHFLAQQHVTQTSVDVAIKNCQFIVAVTRQTLDFFTLDLKRAFVFFHTMAVKDTHLDDRAEIARLDPKRGIAHVTGLFTKDRPKQFFLWSHGAFTLGRDLAHKDIAWLNVCADIYDARLVKVAQCFLADVGDIACDFLWPKLCITSRDFEFLNVDRSKDVIARHAF